MKYEPTAVDVFARVGLIVARWGCGLIICACIALAWIGTP